MIFVLLFMCYLVTSLLATIRRNGEFTYRVMEKLHILYKIFLRTLINTFVYIPFQSKLY
ncbi:hypothetical protein RhiirA1_112640 [Rhizophagus irregularis]|uniref:Uncharacterized protein n=2 Tax=Rhizophagus irregularis TaxID=588596 RepID=A0A2N0S3F8_9GLOM|nr:hypothetical protein GLOIN_2v1667518 [Rhizophagus irregularis DAOM 181602=DAOM 197198]PKC70070.1 hypothetical protein RhiirA1_112640 [Rhizophagus irregularis]POG65300.1 hypothetical protein GLOIN_2v1667518 [Rhizophagus irregularis DAOM 181602=DAOM 197198]GET66204.1 hypothetical protein GLOIN_2v1667518 [Rhizophagus irregularis DAOM 181602=DAOM 197198]|eukprot:XP_025172166.1 hypothetical protein GLOIN_2v1667518 [Rhizophagus irregularis DAOM 181602=DAOM 197198]